MASMQGRGVVSLSNSNTTLGLANILAVKQRAHRASPEERAEIKCQAAALLADGRWKTAAAPERLQWR